MPVSPLQAAKRVLVSVILKLAGIYAVSIAVNRDSNDADVQRGYRRIALKAHPDKGGSEEHFKELSNAKDNWDACKGGNQNQQQGQQNQSQGRQNQNQRQGQQQQRQGRQQNAGRAAGLAAPAASSGNPCLALYYIQRPIYLQI